MGIGFGSINTGLPKDIVKQIIAAEKIPIQKMEVRKEKINDKKKLVGDLIKMMEDLRGTINANDDARSLRELRVDTNKDIVGVALDKNVAQPGNYQLEVLQLAQKSSAMTSGFSSRDDSYVGVGFIQYFLPSGESREIYVDSGSATLDGIAKLINRDTENGLTATVVDDGTGSDTPWRLILSLEETGDGNKAEFPYFYFVDGEHDFYVEYEREAQDARVKLDGFELEFPENKLKDLIPGATIDLKKAKPGEEFSINISEDSDAITAKISELVDKINAILKFIKDQNTLDEKTDTSRTLGGDIVLQSLESRLRSTIFADIPTEFGPARFGDLGVEFQRDGSLKLDDKRFNQMLSNDYNKVSQILVGRFGPEGEKIDGFVEKLQDMVDLALRVPDGLLASRRKSLGSKMEQVDRRIADRQRLIEQKEKNLKDKFARLEGTISRIKNQGAGLGALAASAGNPVQQLG